MTVNDAGDWLDLLTEAAEVGAANPLAFPTRDVTQAQLGWLKCVAPIGVWRDGNQLGKSYGQALDCALFATDRHPYDQTHTGAKEIIVASESWSQFDPLLEKLMALLPRDEVDPKVQYVPGQGVKGYKEPVIPIVAGSGKGTLIRLKTYNQGTTKIAGTTVHRAYLDEPSPFEIYNEVRPRLNRHDGHLRITFTPTLKTGDRVDWLRELIDEDRKKQAAAQRIFEHNVGLSPDAVRVLGGLADWYLVQPASIEAFIEDLLPIEREMRVNGAWSPLVMDRLLMAFSEERCVRAFSWNDGKFGPPMGCTVIVAMDHGANRNKQAVSLVVVDSRNPHFPRVWVVDQLAYEEWATPEQVARDTLDLLRRNGLNYDDVEEWVGDRPTGMNKYGNYIDNKELRQQFARILKRPMYDTPNRRGIKWIHDPQKSAGSMYRGFRAMNTIMKRSVTIAGEEVSHWLYHPRCTASIEACMGFNGDKRNKHKDVLDADRYGMERGISFQHVLPARLAYG